MKEGIFEDGSKPIISLENLSKINIKPLELKCAYAFQGNPEKIFEKFFGTLDPYAQIYGKFEKII